LLKKNLVEKTGALFSQPKPAASDSVLIVDEKDRIAIDVLNARLMDDKAEISEEEADLLKKYIPRLKYHCLFFCLYSSSVSL
jgi:hypothetical protein